MLHWSHVYLNDHAVSTNFSIRKLSHIAYRRFPWSLNTNRSISPISQWQQSTSQSVLASSLIILDANHYFVKTFITAFKFPLSTTFSWIRLVQNAALYCIHIRLTSYWKTYEVSAKIVHQNHRFWFKSVWGVNHCLAFTHIYKCRG